MSQADVSEMLWSDGMGITSTDLNNAQRYLRALLFNGIVAPGAERQIDASNFGIAPYEVRAAQSGAGAITRLGSVRTFGNVAGLIWVPKLSSPAPAALPFNATAGFWPYYLTTDELQTTLAVGDAVNPRIDRVSIHLDYSPSDSASRDFEAYSLGPIVGGVQTYLRTLSSVGANRRQSFTLTKTITQGTPAASPVPPTLPAGDALLADVLVPTAFNSTFTVATQFRDWRVPMRQQVAQVHAPFMHPESGWSTITSWERIASAAAQALVAFLPSTGRARITRITTQATITGAGTIAVLAVDDVSTPPGLTTGAALTLTAGLQDNYTLGGLPLWDTGLACSIDSVPGTPSARYRTAVRFTAGANGDKVGLVRAHLMGHG